MMTQPTNATTTTTTTARTTRKHTTTTQPAEVVGRGFRKRDHALVWMVTSQTEANRWHQVTQQQNGSLVCDCRAAQYNRTCAHVTAVRTLLAVEEAEWQASQPPTLTVPAVTAAPDPRDTAMLYHDNRGFSLFKA